MKKIIDLIKRTVKPGKSHRNPVSRGIPRKAISWRESQQELLSLFDFVDWPYSVPVTWAEVV